MNGLRLDAVVYKFSSVNMKSLNSKLNSTSNSKSKKNAKEQDKRGSEHTPSIWDKVKVVEIAIVGESAAKKTYTRFDLDTVINIADQCLEDNDSLAKSDEITFNLAEDLSFKLRQVIHEAAVKANLSGRTALMASDVEAAFKNLNIEKVYGAPNNYNFIKFSDKNIYYLDDSLVNLVEIAEETGKLVQPHSIKITTKSFPDILNSTKNFITYFDGMCRLVVSDDHRRLAAALHDLNTNANVAPIVNWFYQFANILLQKYIGYDSMTMHALNLIRVLEYNQYAMQFVSEEMLKPLVETLLQRILNASTLIQPMCSLLALLCNRRIGLINIAMTTVMQEMKDMNQHHVLPIISILNDIGTSAFQQLTQDHWNFIFAATIKASNSDVISAFQRTYRIAFIQNAAIDAEIWRTNNASFLETFDCSVVPMWCPDCNCRFTKPESNIKFLCQKYRMRLIKFDSKPRHKLRDVFELSNFRYLRQGQRKLEFKYSTDVLPIRNAEPKILNTIPNFPKQKYYVGSRKMYCALFKVRCKPNTCQYNLSVVL